MQTNQAQPGSGLSLRPLSINASSIVRSSTSHAKVSQSQPGQAVYPIQRFTNQQLLPNISHQYAFQQQGCYHFGQDKILTFKQQQSAINNGRLIVQLDHLIISQVRSNIS